MSFIKKKKQDADYDYVDNEVEGSSSMWSSFEKKLKKLLGLC